MKLMHAPARLGHVLLALALAAGAGKALAQALPDFTALVEENAPAIVNVDATRSANLRDEEARRNLEDLLRYFYGEEMPEGEIPRAPELRGRQPAAMGSGFIISADGYVITNHHVVADAEEISITLNDRREFSAVLVGSDQSSDLALLKVEAENLPVARLAEADDLKVGEWVLAIGSPFGLNYSVAAGIVSYIGRNLPAMNGIGDYVSYIQTDVAINPGHSGGPLFNLDGEVVGVNSQIFTNSGGSIGLSFAIPAGMARNVIAQLKDSGSVSRGWMGVQIGNVSPELAEAFRLTAPRGALINQVQEGSPAQEAGFRSGDVIVRFDGQDIITNGDLPYQVGLQAPGSQVEVDIIRDGEPLTIGMTVGKLDTAARTAAAAPPAASSRLGVEVAAVDEELRRSHSLEAGEGGVVVREVTGEVGREARFQPGDILLSIDNRGISGVEGFERLAAALPAGQLLPVLVSRNGDRSFFTVRIPE